MFSRGARAHPPLRLGKLWEHGETPCATFPRGGGGGGGCPREMDGMDEMDCMDSLCGNIPKTHPALTKPICARRKILSILSRWSVAKTIFPKEKSEALILSKKPVIASASLRLCERKIPRRTPTINYSLLTIHSPEAHPAFYLLLFTFYLSPFTLSPFSIFNSQTGTFPLPRAGEKGMLFLSRERLPFWDSFFDGCGVAPVAPYRGEYTFFANLFCTLVQSICLANDQTCGSCETHLSASIFEQSVKYEVRFF